MESKDTKKSDQSIISKGQPNTYTTRYLVTYFLKRIQKYGDQGRHTEIVKGDLEEWFNKRSSENPNFVILVECCQYIW